MNQTQHYPYARDRAPFDAYMREIAARQPGLVPVRRQVPSSGALVMAARQTAQYRITATPGSWFVGLLLPIAFPGSTITLQIQDRTSEEILFDEPIRTAPALPAPLSAVAAHGLFKPLAHPKLIAGSGVLQVTATNISAGFATLLLALSFLES